MFVRMLSNLCWFVAGMVCMLALIAGGAVTIELDTAINPLFAFPGLAYIAVIVVLVALGMFFRRHGYRTGRLSPRTR